MIACADLLLGRGHRIAGIVSDCPQVSRWTQKTGIPRVGAAEDQREFLGREPFDYLFSIVNHAITPAEILALPAKAAINYHDSLLPDHGGFNATAWAILDGRKEHGVTWHRMTGSVDAGEILAQATVPIGEEDTAFTLAAQCGHAAISSFESLLDALEAGKSAGRPAEPTRSFHFRSERPGAAVLDWARPAAELQRLVRGLNFGPDDNWMCTAKVLTPGGEFIRAGAAAVLDKPAAAAGTLGAASAEALEVSAGGAVLRLSELSTLDGRPLTDQLLSQLKLAPGARLAAPAPGLLDAARQLDAAVTKHERYWVRQLAALSQPQLNEIKPHERRGSLARVAVPLPASTLKLPPEERTAAVCAAVIAYLVRVGEDVAKVDLGLYKEAFAGELRTLYATVVPLGVQADAATPFAELAVRVRGELALNVERKTYARDAFQRYGSLRGRTEAECRLPIAICLSAFKAAQLPEGVRLLFAIDPDSSRLSVAFDDAAVSEGNATRLAERLVRLLETATRDATSAPLPVGQLPVLTAAEQALLLQTWQDTARPYASNQCVHQLFADQVKRTPDKVALAFRDETLTYRQLDERANALAQHLHRQGAGPEHLVGICVERSLHMVIGLLAIMKSGAAYVPMDPAYPAERLAMMIEDSGARLLLTQSHLVGRLPRHGASVVLIDEIDLGAAAACPAPDIKPDNLAYVIFTSGSSGRPKGVMVQHGNVCNFFAGMDEVIGTEPGIWLAVTSISFDISVLEIFWTLCRGFELVIQEEADRSSLLKSQSRVKATSTPMGFGLFYFAADSSGAGKSDVYRLLLEGARFADAHEFTAVWTPERHFHAFGGLYPNPAVTSAAIAAITRNVELRAGSVVIPLHDPIRVAEEWAIVDNISQGRVGLSFASGWHANDFALMPGNYERRREVMQESIDTVLKLWAGEKIKVKNGLGQEIEVGVLPRPFRERPPMWLASAGNIDTFRAAGRAGYNILTNMLGQDLEDLRKKFAAYREARRENGHGSPGIISVMLHTFVTDDDEKARQLARKPFCDYMASSYDLVKVAPWMFPAFRQPSQAASGKSAFDPSSFDAEDMAALLDHAFERYFDTAGLFGTPQRALEVVEQLKEIGATEVACLIDFGIAPDVVLDNLVHLDALRKLANPKPVAVAAAAGGLPVTVREQFERRRITHLQCTPSMARMLVADGSLPAMGSLRKFLLGGEALPADLVDKIAGSLGCDILNMYGPTETTIWSTAQIARAGQPISIGRPIANTRIRILDPALAMVPVGTPGELCIGGAGVVRGYLNRPDLTAERFVADPYAEKARLYRTGDLARYRDDGALEYIGRIDQQVKVNGYRIELGEIEAVLGRHPAVRQSVVAVKDGPSGPALVGYVIAQAGDAGDDKEQRGVGDWRQRWNEAYKKGTGAAGDSPRFNTSGWLESYTGEPIPREQMREWLDNTVARIMELSPKRVLEIGCGTGMILYGCLARVDHYTAVDLSAHALEAIRTELSAEERRKVTLLNQAAHELDSIARGSCDVIIINSVAQYFPSADYLTRVLARASELLADGGKIFLGDVRSAEEAQAFYTLVELHQAPGQAGAAQLAGRIAERAADETELLLSAGYFAQLHAAVPRLNFVSMQLKRGRFSNEMRDFRCDVVLQAGPAPEAGAAGIEPRQSPADLAAIRQMLAAKPAALWLQNIVNPRVEQARKIATQLETGGAALSAEGLRRELQQAPRGIDPELLYALDPDYAVETRWSAMGGRYDALFRQRQRGPVAPWPLAPAAAGVPVASTPHARFDAEALIPKLKTHLRDYLPEYMVPQAFELLSEFPLTPNGKIDRKALRAPQAKTRQPAAGFVIPGNELERTIAQIWQELLNLERVGKKDNIFDLGANSLLTVEANNKLQTRLGRKIPLVNMFRFPTIESLASHLSRSAGGDAAAAAAAPGGSADSERERQDRLNAAAERRRRARAQKK
jgi:natural product biosynthesis luciferase-like monooxygenase protein